MDNDMDKTLIDVQKVLKIQFNFDSITLFTLELHLG